MRETSEIVEPAPTRRALPPRTTVSERHPPPVGASAALTTSAISRLQREAGNTAVSRLVEGAVVQRQTKSKYALEQMVKELEPREKETSAKYLTRLHRKHQGAGLDEEDKSVLATFARSWWDDMLSDVVAEKEEARKKAAAEEERARRFAPVRDVGFTTLDADVDRGFYRVVRTASTKTRYASAESTFEAYSGGTSVAVAVEEAIAGLLLSGDTRAQHTRHDFQPSRDAVVNLQVQLGGSGNFRVGKGDTSSTIVVIDAGLWADMLRADPARWTLVIQAAHRESFAGSSRIDILPGRL